MILTGIGIQMTIQEYIDQIAGDDKGPRDNAGEKGAPVLRSPCGLHLAWRLIANCKIPVSPKPPGEAACGTAGIASGRIA